MKKGDKIILIIATVAACALFALGIYGVVYGGLGIRPYVVLAVGMMYEILAMEIQAQELERQEREMYRKVFGDQPGIFFLYKSIFQIIVKKQERTGLV